jgi:hypothetical protein
VEEVRSKDGTAIAFERLGDGQPVIVVGGATCDRAMARPAHAVEFFELLGVGLADAGWDGSGMPDARLATLPATTHYDIFSSPALASTVALFLDAPMPEIG